MMTAEEARKRATDVTQGVHASVVADIEAHIDDAVRKGDLSMNYYKSVPTAVEEYFEKQGYTLKYHSGGYRYDESYTEISW